MEERSPSLKNHREYANCFKVGYNALEFLLDFGQLYEAAEAEYFHTGIVTSPGHAKNLLYTLRDSIAGYEEDFGTIPPLDDLADQP